MYLPGTIGQRIGDLRSGREWSQRKLSEMSGITPSQINRLEGGVTKHISHNILIKLSKAFGVSTDYILGLTTVSTPKSYEISELGLSEGAVKAMVIGKIDVSVLNRLLEHEKFPPLTKLIKAYFEDTLAAGVKGRNEIIDMAVSALITDHKKDAQDDRAFLRTQKLGDHDAEIEKIKANFLIMLRDIKKSIESSESPDAPATSKFLQQIWEQAQAARQEQKTITAEDMTAMVMNVVGKSVPMNDKSAELFKQLAQQVFSGKQ